MRPRCTVRWCSRTSTRTGAVAGDGLWRTRCLLTPPTDATLLDRLLVQGSGTTMGVCAGFVGVHAWTLLATGWPATLCPL